MRRLVVVPHILRWWLACRGFSVGLVKWARARCLVVAADVGKGGGVMVSIVVLLAAAFAISSAVSLPVILLWLGIQFRWKWVWGWEICRLHRVVWIARMWCWPGWAVRRSVHTRIARWLSRCMFTCVVVIGSAVASCRLGGCQRVRLQVL